jgi:TonB family protein
MQGQVNRFARVAICFLFAGSAQSVLAEQNVIPHVVIPADCVPPDWPDSSVRFDEPPDIDLELLIDVAGAVLKTKLVKSSGSKTFDDAARVALARCIYPPLSRAGKPVRGWVSVHYRWTLE